MMPLIFLMSQLDEQGTGLQDESDPYSHPCHMKINTLLFGQGTSHEAAASVRRWVTGAGEDSLMFLQRT